MKNTVLIFLLLLATVTLTACNGKAGGTQENLTQQIPSDAAAAQSVVPVDEPMLMSNDKVVALAASQAEQIAQTVTDATAEAPETQQAVNDPSIDLDLTAISGTVVYSQVYDMIMQPEVYSGQRIRMKGTFGYYQDPDTKKEYFAAVIADATACCAQGIEFVWKGDHTYPDDYPLVDTDITVTGIFGTYEENGYTYIHLTDAEVSW